MHQHLRHPPTTASPANAGRNDPPSRPSTDSRTSEPSSPRISYEQSMNDGAQEEGDATDNMPRPARPPASDGKDAVAKLNQVVQNFFSKAALLVLSHRASLAPALSKETNEKRVNKWFNVEIDETNDLLEHLRLWKSCHVQDHRPPAMIIEVYIDAAPTTSHSLILQDALGHQWGVGDAIKSYIDTNCYGEKFPEAPRIILERWRCQLGRQTHDFPPELTSLLPKVYKNSIVLFRSLFAYIKMLPAWDMTRKAKKLTQSQKPPQMRYRIYEEGNRPEAESPVFDELELALDDGRTPVTDHYAFDPIDSPAGPYSVEVTFRRNCDFRLEKGMESVYSSRFIGQDEEALFRPSLDRFGDKPSFKRQDSERSHHAGSLPRQRPSLAEIAEQSQAYGSLSTYHGAIGRVSSSPMSALRAARDMNTEEPASEDSPSLLKPQTEHRLSQGSRTPLQSNDSATAGGTGRRTSVSFMPFKSPSLSASPLQGEVAPTAGQRTSIGRASALSALAEARKPSANASLAPVTRALPVPSSSAPQDPQHPASLSSSPRPTPSSRYSSSFGHRRSKLSIGGSKTEDDNSSGKVSLASSTQRGSAAAEGGGNHSSGSLHTDDDDNISDFLKMLDQKKDLKSFQAPLEPAPGDVAAPRRSTAAGLSKFQRLKDTNAALTDSMATSLQFQRTPSTSSNRPSAGVAPTAIGTGPSVSTSPGERMSPRTPHTPAIPSRLSANSIIDYNAHEPAPGASDGAQESRSARRARRREDSGAISPRGTGAIDIPTSPRFNPSYRRSSSVAQQQHRVYDEDFDGDSIGYVLRSASVGDRDDRQPLHANELLNLNEGSSGSGSGAATQLAAQRQQNRLSDDNAMTRQRSSDSHKSQDDELPLSPRRGVYRLRSGRGTGRGVGSSHGSTTSLAGEKSAGSGSSDARGSRYSFTRTGNNNFEDEEPLLFAMSDFNTVQQGRRSLEETPRGGDMGGLTESTSQRGGRRTGGRGWS